MTLTLLGPDHVGAMADLHASAFSAQEAWTASALLDLVILPSSSAFGLFDGGNLRALLLVQFADPELEILTIATAPDARRQGLANQLIAHAERKFGPSKTMLDVAADNVGAIAFYNSLGFLEDARRKGYYNRLEGQRVDAILMSKLN